ncbi:serine/threonine protein kinase [Acaricomes phytoseiuli]|uniref:serine/threonine-protein kinase n=1 Tax=Acaricomes phytoseiuli TaxID=291968 RepID=UPI002223040E|nr:serine/threonine-protein kinase [Acaricomes phytoseiuli]MCW1249288.1 serine/threonine protein kinase [Acaricomes phytoseiuli]
MDVLPVSAARMPPAAPATRPAGAISTLNERYQLGEKLGMGAYATVFRAQDLAWGRAAAIKLFAPGTRRADAEFHVLCRVQHPFLVSLYDYGRWNAGIDGCRPALVMELVTHGDLRDRLGVSGGALSPTATAQLGWAVSSALAALHENGIVHRDVKPANILLTSSGLPKLCDFGVSRLQDSGLVTAPGATIGTASYLSPEQATGDPVGPSADIYSLGLVLLECLTGVRAFPGPALEAAVARLLKDPQIPDSLSPAWRQLLAAMTVRDPAQRPNADECTEALFRLQRV